MPYPNEHAARVKSPGAFQADSFRRKTVAPGVSLILGRLKGETSMTAQAYRFDKDKFTTSEAKKWLKDHDVSYLSFEAASGKEAAAVAVESEKEAETVEEKQYAGEVIYAVPYGATSFAQIDEYMTSVETSERAKELVRQFQSLTENIMFSPDVEDRTTAMKSLFAEFEVRIGEAMQGQKSLLDKAVDKVRDVLGLRPQFQKVEKLPASRLMVWKQDGGYRWFAVYSNKFRDEDHPPEILSATAHKEFIAKVDAGEEPYPELRHFHVQGTKWGQSDWMAFDDKTGMSMASGTVDHGHEKEAEAVMAMPEPVGVSHGLEVIARNEKDTSIIEEYRSYEISDLPLEAAANKLTGFHVIEEGGKEMAIPDEKKAYLKKVGLSDEQISSIDADLEGKAQVAQSAGLEFKQEAKPEGERKDEPVVSPETAAPPYATRDEVATAIVEAQKPILEAITALTGVVQTMAKSDAEKVASKAADTPALSIAALVTQKLSTIGKDATRLTVQDMALAKDKPQETDGTATKTGIPFIDGFLGPKPS